MKTFEIVSPNHMISTCRVEADRVEVSENATILYARQEVVAVVPKDFLVYEYKHPA